jgi:hypothetical protein
MSDKRNKGTPTIYMDLGSEEKLIDCPIDVEKSSREPFQCIIKSFVEENGQNKIMIDVCPHSPCIANLYKFGIHEKIIELNIRMREFDDSYSYFKDLVPQFPIDCDLTQLEKYKKDGIDDLPAGCKLFVKNTELRKEKDDILALMNTVSEKGNKLLYAKIESFRANIMDNLERLSHLAIDKRQKTRDIITERKFKLLSISAQVGDLKAKSMELPIDGNVEKTIKETTDGEKPKSKNGF